MCFNCVIISENNRVSSAITRELVKKMLANPHGYAIYSYSYASQKLIRTLNFRKALIALLKLSKNSSALHLHFRFATSGTITVDNVHLWNISDFLVSHNGFVSSYAYISHISPANIDSDSKRFVHSEEFKKALETRDFSTMWDLAMRKGFYGFMLMTNKDFSEIYIMTNKPFYFLKHKGLTIISNENISEDLSVISEHGIYRYHYHNGNLEQIVKPKLDVLYSPIKHSYIYDYDDDYSYYIRYLFDDYSNDDDEGDDDEAKDCDNNASTIYDQIRCKIKIKKSKTKHKTKSKTKHKTKKNKKNKNEYEDYVFF